jgi:biopolymer transport protein ExbD
MRTRIKTNSEITNGPMADIAFLLLVFFLVTTTMDVDYGITSNISKPFEIPDSVSLEISTLLLNQHGDLLLDDKTVQFENLSQEIANEFNKSIAVKNVLLVKSEREVDYHHFIRTLNESKKGFNEFYNNLALDEYALSFDELSDSSKTKLQILHPVSLAEDILEI